MLKAQTKLTSQGQVSVPAAVRHVLGLTPGATIEWTQEGDSIVVRRAVQSSTNDVHEALFPGAEAGTPAKTLAELKQGIRQHMQRRHARG
jgi:antitoxin PrlF